MTSKLSLNLCPTCGSPNIKRVVRNLTRQYHGQTYTVPKVTFYTCPDCGENVYGPEAMLKIRAHSPAYRKTAVLAEA